MTKVLPYFQCAAFDPDMTHIMGEAFDRACEDLHVVGQPDIVREVIASRIINAARDGERDPRRLYEQALKGFGFQTTIWIARDAGQRRSQRPLSMRELRCSLPVFVRPLGSGAHVAGVPLALLQRIAVDDLDRPRARQLDHTTMLQVGQRTAHGLDGHR